MLVAPPTVTGCPADPGADRDSGPTAGDESDFASVMAALAGANPPASPSTPPTGGQAPPGPVAPATAATAATATAATAIPATPVKGTGPATPATPATPVEPTGRADQRSSAAADLSAPPGPGPATGGQAAVGSELRPGSAAPLSGVGARPHTQPAGDPVSPASSLAVALDASAVEATGAPNGPGGGQGSGGEDDSADSDHTGESAGHGGPPSAGHPVGPAPAAPARPGNTVTAPAPAARPESLPLSDQIVSVVEPLRHRGDGHHELTLDLRPAELGPIRVEVTVEGRTVHLSLHAGEAATGELLHRSMPELRAALEEAGLVAGRLGVGPGGGDQPNRDQSPTRPEAESPERPAAAAPRAVPATRAVTAGAVDLLL